MKTMLDILKERLPEGLQIIKVKDKASSDQMEIWFSYEGMEGNGWLRKTCAPGYAGRNCDYTIANAMLGFALQRRDLEMAEFWKDKLLNG